MPYVKKSYAAKSTPKKKATQPKYETLPGRLTTDSEPYTFTHTFFTLLESLWEEKYDTPPTSMSQCRDFLYCLQYKERKIDLIADDEIFDVVRHLYRYLKHVDKAYTKRPYVSAASAAGGCER